MEDKTLHEAFENWEALSGTAEQRIAYEGRMKRIFDEEAAVREAELRVEEGIKEGEQSEKKKIALRLLTAGMDIDSVVLATELTKEQVLAMMK